MTDIPNVFKCADPYVVKNGDTYYLFFEAAYHDGITPNVEVGNSSCYATSTDLINWTYGGIVTGTGAGNGNQIIRLDDVNGDLFGWYMTPNVGNDKYLDLYICLHFPDTWGLHKRIITDSVAVRDAAIFYYEGYWYIHYGTYVVDFYERLWVSSDLLHGTFTEHPASPILTGDEHYRSGGRPVVHPGVGVDIFVQKCDVVYGEASRIFRLSNLTPTTCTVTELGTSPIVAASVCRAAGMSRGCTPSTGSMPE